MCIYPYVTTSSSPSPYPPSFSPRATAKSSDITRMFQRRRDPDRGDGAAEGEDIAAATHTCTNRSVGRYASYPGHMW